MKQWAQRTGIVSSGGQKEIPCEVTFYEHNWRGCFITIRPNDADEYVGIHGVRAVCDELAKEYSFDRAEVYSYMGESQCWDWCELRKDGESSFKNGGVTWLPVVPGFLMERQIHFGDFAKSYEDFVEQTRSTQRHFAEEACNVVLAGKMRRAWEDESDPLSPFEDPAPYQKAIEAFNEELQRKRFTEAQEITVVPAHLRISQQQIIADPEAELQARHEAQQEQEAQQENTQQAQQQNTQDLNQQMTY